MLTDGEVTNVGGPTTATHPVVGVIVGDATGLESIDSVVSSSGGRLVDGELGDLPDVVDTVVFATWDTQLADTDGDGLTDCVESSGAFVPLFALRSDIDADPEWRSGVIFTDPVAAHSDVDGYMDGMELEERDLRENPDLADAYACLLYTSPSPRDQRGSRMPSSA